MTESPTVSQLTSHILALMEKDIIEADEGARFIRGLSASSGEMYLTSVQRVLRMLEAEHLDADEALNLLESLASQELVTEPACAQSRLHITLSEGSDADEPSEELIVTLCDLDRVEELLPRGIRQFVEQNGISLAPLIAHLTPERSGTVYLTRSGDWVLEIAVEG